MRKKYLFSFFVLIVVAFAFRLPFFFTPLNFDENHYSYIAWQIFDGKGFYSTDWDNKPPLVHLMYLLNYILLGNLSVFSVRLFGFFYGIMTVGVFFKLAYRIFQKFFWSWFATLFFTFLFFHPTLQGQYSNTENFFVVWVLLAFLMIFTGIRRVHWSFFFMGIAFLFKPTTIFSVVPLIVYYYSQQRRTNGVSSICKRLLKEGLIFLLPSLFFVIYFSINGIGQNAFDWIILKNFVHVSEGRRSASALTLFLQNFSGIFRATGIVWVMGVLGALFVIWKRNWDRSALILVWFLSTAVSVFIGGWFFQHYFLEAVAPVVLLATLLMQKWYNWFSQQRRKHIYIGGYAISVMLLFGISITVLTPLFYDWVRYFRFMNGFEREKIIPTAEIGYYEAGEYLRKNLNPHDTLFVWDGSADLYFLSNHHPVIRNLWKYSFLNDNLQYPTLRGWFHDYINARQRLRQYLAQNPPTSIVITMDYRTIAEEYKVFPDFFEFLFAHYHLEQVFGDILIYRYNATQPISEPDVFFKLNQTEDLVSRSYEQPSGTPDQILIVRGFTKIIDSVSVTLEGSRWKFPSNGLDFPIVMHNNGADLYFYFEPSTSVPTSLYEITLHFIDGTTWSKKLHAYQFENSVATDPTHWQIHFPSDIYSDVVSLGNTEASGIRDVVMQITDLRVPVREAMIIIGDHEWHGPMNGINSPIVFQQNSQHGIFYFEPRDFRGGERGTIKLFFVDGTVAERYFFLPKNGVWAKK